ncbi:MAG: flagellar hook-length control protein FliK [Casimicrobiaceae bacterium]
MPVAFRPPLEHPVEAPQAVHQADDSGDGDIFAAMLADAGKLPSAVPAAGAAGTDAAQEATGSGKDDEHHKTPAAADAFDPATAFVAWAAMPLAAMNLVTQPADAGKAVGAGAAAAAGDAAQRIVGNTAVADALAQPAAGAAQRTANAAGATLATLATDADPHAPAAHHVPAPPARNVVRAPGEKPDTPGAPDVKAAASKPAEVASTPFALAAALLARTPDAKGAASMAIDAVSATKDRDAADPAPGVNLAASTAPTPPVPVYTLAQPVGNAGFAAEAAGQIAQLVHINSERAQLHVHPADMGPIDVTLQVHRGEVSVSMVAPDPHTRAALEQSLPQLRDLLANQGLALTNASVNDQSPRGGGQPAGGQTRGSSVAAVTGVGAGVDAFAAAPMPASVAIRRLVDLYA